jgi:hypothetical protein
MPSRQSLLKEESVFKCPVCRHATFNWIQYTFVAGVSTVECSNCHTVLHQRRRLRNTAAALPLAFMPLAQHMGWSKSPSVEWYLLAACASVALGLATWLTELEPVAPRGPHEHEAL